MVTSEREARRGLALLGGSFFSALVKAEAGRNPSVGCWFAAVRTANERGEQG